MADVLAQVAQFGVPPAGAARLLDVGTNRFLHFFRTEVLNGMVAHGGGILRFFEGPYGSGKTHLLDLLAEDAFEAGMAVARIDLSTASGLADWQLITERILADMEFRSPSATARSLPQVLDLLHASYPAVVAGFRNHQLPHSGFARAIELQLKGGTGHAATQLLRHFLLGERVSVRDLRAAGLPGVKHPLSSRNAEYVLRTALVGLRRAGAAGTVLLFDESERTFHRASKKVQAGANLLRRFVDAAAAGTLESCAAVFAVLPGFVEAAAEVYPALGQRVFPVPVDGVRPWRSPMLLVSDVTEVSDADSFLRSLVARIVGLVQSCRVKPDGLAQSLQETGAVLLKANAGAGVRRDLSKALCEVALRHLENGRASS